MHNVMHWSTGCQYIYVGFNLDIFARITFTHPDDECDFIYFSFAHANALPCLDFYGRDVPRWNFTDMFHSFMVVFRSLCGEWVESFYDCIVATDATSIVYFCALALIGSFAVSIFFCFHSFIYMASRLL